MGNEVTATFTEDQARDVLWAWCEKQEYSSAQILQLTKWEFAEPPVYSAHVQMWRGGIFPEVFFVQIKHNGEVIKFPNQNE